MFRPQRRYGCRTRRPSAVGFRRPVLAPAHRHGTCLHHGAPHDLDSRLPRRRAGALRPSQGRARGLQECTRPAHAPAGGETPAAPITFDFGSNGEPGHVDGNNYGTAKSFTSGSYTLALTGMSNVFGPAYDETGNSCLKLGTSGAIGSFSFTVGEDVTSVVIYVAKYKAKNTKVTINGTEYTISTSSNDGEYTAIEVDTATNKTINFATVSGNCRCMINTIEFVVAA